MSTNERLAPIGHVLLPIPSFERNTGIPISDATASNASKNHGLSRESPLSDLQNLATRQSSSVTHHFPIGNPDPPSFPPKHANDSFTFVEICAPSGKTNSTASSQVRSHVMQRVQENRHTLRQIRLKAAAGCSDKNCVHFEVRCTPRNQVLAVNIVHDNSTGFHTGSPVVQNICLGSHDSRIFHYKGHLASSNPTIIANQKVATLSKSYIVCTECGRLTYQNLPTNWENKLTTSLEGPQTLLGASPTDPFNSSVISMSHRMHELIHHCKSSSVREFSRYSLADKDF
jgi:hypothetical protein